MNIMYGYVWMHRCMDRLDDYNVWMYGCMDVWIDVWMYGSEEFEGRVRFLTKNIQY